MSKDTRGWGSVPCATEWMAKSLTLYNVIENMSTLDEATLLTKGDLRQQGSQLGGQTEEATIG